MHPRFYGRKLGASRWHGRCSSAPPCRSSAITARSPRPSGSASPQSRFSSSSSHARAERPSGPTQMTRATPATRRCNPEEAAAPPPSAALANNVIFPVASIVGSHLATCACWARRAPLGNLCQAPRPPRTAVVTRTRVATPEHPMASVCLLRAAMALDVCRAAKTTATAEAPRRVTARSNRASAVLRCARPTRLATAQTSCALPLRSARAFRSRAPPTPTATGSARTARARPLVLASRPHRRSRGRHSIESPRSAALLATSAFLSAGAYFRQQRHREEPRTPAETAQSATPRSRPFTSGFTSGSRGSPGPSNQRTLAAIRAFNQ